MTHFEQAQREAAVMTPAERFASLEQLAAELRRRVLIVLSFNIGARPIEVDALADELASASASMRRLGTIPLQQGLS